MYKLIAIDLDGTLLDSYSEISEKTKIVLNIAIKKGIEVVISSGRTVDSIKSITDDIIGKNYIIAGNGSILYNLKENHPIYEMYMSKDKVINIINICEENSITYSVYTNKAIVSNSLKYNVLYYYKENLKKAPSKQTNIIITQDTYEYVKNMPQDEKVIKIFICDKNKSVFNAIMKKISSIDEIQTLDVSHMARKYITNGNEEIPIEYFYTEVSEKSVDKWFALDYLINMLNIDSKDVIAIGDNVNDKKMIENAGVGIAMKNSTPQLTDIADYVTDFDNNHNGVANAIEKFIDIL